MRSDRAREVAGAFSELLASSVSPAEQPGFPHMESMCREGAMRESTAALEALLGKSQCCFSHRLLSRAPPTAKREPARGRAAAQVKHQAG